MSIQAKTIKKALLIGLLALSSAALAISGWNIIKYRIDSDALARIETKIKESVKENDTPDAKNRLEIDFQDLKAQNDETVAYLKVYGTTIDCPVVKAADNEFYLNHSFDKSYNILGWVFADYRNQFDGTDKNTIIYGHNLNDGSLFGSLINVLDADWQSNLDNQKIILATESGTKVYQTFSTYDSVPEKYYITTDFETDEDYQNFLTEIKNRSNHDYGVGISQNDQILTLSSCIGTGQKRVVLHAKRVF